MAENSGVIYLFSSQVLSWGFQPRFEISFNLAAIERLERVLDAVHRKRVVVAWRYAAIDSKRAKEFFEV